MTKIGVFASGRGSNFQTIYHRTRDGTISAQIALLISDNENAGALAFARAHNIATHVVKPKDFSTPEAFGNALLGILAPADVDLLVLAGYLQKIPANVVKTYPHRIVNIHPALLPAFGGRGMYGRRVHEAVFRSGAKFSGVTVHLVNNEYDAGPIVLQKVVPIDDCRSPEAIAERVLAQEHIAFPEALQLILQNKMEVEGNRVRFIKKST